jgi:hypothetical protein
MTDGTTFEDAAGAEHDRRVARLLAAFSLPISGGVEDDRALPSSTQCARTSHM